MAKRKPVKRRYGDYTQIIDDELYAVVNLRQPDGKYKKKYKKVADARTATQWALDELAKHKKGLSFDEDLTFEDFAAWYLKDILTPPIFERGIKVAGVKDHAAAKNKLLKMAGFFGKRLMRDFNESDLLRWARHRRERDEVCAATLNRDFSLLRTVLRRGQRYKKIEHVPNFEINNALENERGRVLSFAEETRLLAACVDKEKILVKPRKKQSRVKVEYEMTINAKRAHLRPIIILAVETAMRRGEIFSLLWSDIDLTARSISVKAQNTKTQKARQIGITPRLEAELRKLNRSDGAVFSIKDFKRAFGTACVRASVGDLVFHDLRHTAITRMVAAGIPHTEIMKISGHTQLKTFMRYLNMTAPSVQSASEKLAAFFEQNQPG